MLAKVDALLAVVSSRRRKTRMKTDYKSGQRPGDVLDGDGLHGLTNATFMNSRLQGLYFNQQSDNDY